MLNRTLSQLTMVTLVALLPISSWARSDQTCYKKTGTSGFQEFTVDWDLRSNRPLSNRVRITLIKMYDGDATRKDIDDVYAKPASDRSSYELKIEISDEQSAKIQLTQNTDGVTAFVSYKDREKTYQSYFECDEYPFEQ